MIRKFDPSYVYEITFQCSKCPAEWKIAEVRPVDVWYQLYQKKWEIQPELESPRGFMKAKCGACVAEEIRIQKELRKALMAEQAKLKIADKSIEVAEPTFNYIPEPMVESLACVN